MTGYSESLDILSGSVAPAEPTALIGGFLIRFSLPRPSSLLLKPLEL